jgi:hypothetical protein
MSEIARIRQQIAAEYDAACRGLEGPAIIARHEFIAARMDTMGRSYNELTELLGEQEAIRVVAETIWPAADFGYQSFGGEISLF